MTITSQINAAITTGFNRPNRHNHSHEQKQNQENQTRYVTPEATTLLPTLSTQRIRETISAQSMQDQSLSHRASQAKNMYQGIEQSGEVELMPRLDVSA